MKRLTGSVLIRMVAIASLIVASVAVAEPVEKETLDALNDLMVPEESNDKEVLVALYHATNGKSWTRNDGWLSDSPIGEWHGVTERLGRVREIDLSDNGLSGRLPEELSQLTGLRLLDLRWNKLSGPLPELSKLWRIKRLLLTDNKFGGAIPDWIAKIRDLERLDLSHNRFRGKIPSKLALLTNLQSLALHHNNLKGTVPAEIGKLEVLRRLILNDNRLAGPIPEELGTLRSLRHLNLANNRLSGSVPKWISSSEDLEWVDLRGNSIEPNSETFRIALPDYYDFWTYRGDSSSDKTETENFYRLDSSRSIVVDMWAQTSEVIETFEVRSFVLRSLSMLEVREGFVILSQENLPEYVRIGNIREIVATLNSHLEDSNIRVSTSNELERSFEAVDGVTPGRETVHPFSTDKPPERFHIDKVLEDGTQIHLDGIIISGIHALLAKRREDLRTRNSSVE